MSNTGRYRVEPLSLLDKIQELKRRIALLERSPKIGNTSIDGGSLRIKIDDGLKVADEDGNIIIETAGSPQRPRFRIYTAEDTNDTQFEAGGSITDFGPLESGTQIFVNYSLNTIPDFGFVSSWETGTAIGKAVAESSTSYFEARNLSGFGFPSDHLRMFGRFADRNPQTAGDTLYTGTDTTGAVSSITVNYPFTFNSTIAPVVGVLNSGGAISFVLTAQSTSSFTLAWTGGAVAKTLNFWNVRIP